MAMDDGLYETRMETLIQKSGLSDYEFLQMQKKKRREKRHQLEEPCR